MSQFFLTGGQAVDDDDTKTLIQTSFMAILRITEATGIAFINNKIIYVIVLLKQTNGISCDTLAVL